MYNLAPHHVYSRPFLSGVFLCQYSYEQANGECYHRWVFPTRSGFLGLVWVSGYFFLENLFFFIRGHNFVFPIIISLTAVIHGTWKVVVKIFVLDYYYELLPIHALLLAFSA